VLADSSSFVDGELEWTLDTVCTNFSSRLQFGGSYSRSVTNASPSVAGTFVTAVGTLELNHIITIADTLEGATN